MGQPKLQERVPNRDNMIHMGIELSGTCVVLTRSAHMLRPDANVLSRRGKETETS